METCTCLDVDYLADTQYLTGALRVHRAAGALWTLPANSRRPVKIICVRGMLWITIEGCPRDIVLAQEQDSHTFEGSGKLVVQALTDAAFEISTLGPILK